MMQIFIVESSPSARKTLQLVLAEQGLKSCTVIRPQDLGSAPEIDAVYLSIAEAVPAHFDVRENDRFAKPLRVGALLDRIHWHMNESKSGDEVIAIGPHDLDIRSNDLQLRSGGAPIRLTQKERHILELLARVPGEIISRRVLLDEVWGYGENIETHTLETHIYRLRQKIEADPAMPALLITDEQGYRLKI